MADSGDKARTVIIAMDRSEYSDYGFQYYVEQVHRPNDHIVLVYVPQFHNITMQARYMDNVHRMGDHIVLLHSPEYHTIVQSPMVMADVTVVTDLLQQEEKEIKEYLEILGQKLKAHNVGGKVKSVGGSPGEVIVRVAEEEGAALIVTGTRGMGQIRRTFMGSVSDYIVHHSHIPVLVCRHKDHHHHHDGKKE